MSPPAEFTGGTGGGEGVGEEPNHTTARKPGPLENIQYSLGCDIDRLLAYLPKNFAVILVFMSGSN